MNKTTDVHWIPFPTNEIPTNWEEDLFLEFEPVIKHISQERNTAVEYLTCPAFLEYYKNAFVFRSPIDMVITVINGTVSLESNKVCISRAKQNGVFSTLVVDIQTLFLTEESVTVEQLPAAMESTLPLFRIIPGEFNIGKWIRPVTFSFEIVDNTQSLIIKRGDPLFYVRFRTPDNKKIKLVRTKETSNIRDLATICVHQKYKTPNNTLEENYSVAQELGVCPFKH
jgi:hypothetical protein